MLVDVVATDKDISIEPRFVLVENGLEKGYVSAKIIDKSWNKKTNLWNMVYKLDFSAFRAGSYVLHIKGNLDASILEAGLRVRIYKPKAGFKIQFPPDVIIGCRPKHNIV